MFKRTRFTTISPLPPNITRQVVVDFLHDHQEMIDLNPLVKERHPIAPPPHAPPEEMDCVWYSLTDKISYLPGDLYTGDVTYTCAFNDLRNGVQTHCYAPAGLTIRDKWTLNGSLPDEPSEPIELGIGAPVAGLYIREDVDMRCNVLLTTFVKRTLKKSHAALIERLKSKAQMASGGVPLPQQQYQQQQASVTLAGNGNGNGNGKLDPELSLAGLSLIGSSKGSSFDSGYGGGGNGTERSETSTVASGDGASGGPPNRVMRTPSPGLGVSAQVMQHYEQSLHMQLRTPPPLQQYGTTSQVQYTQPPPVQYTHAQSQSQSQPQLHLTEYQPPQPRPPPPLQQQKQQQAYFPTPPPTKERAPSRERRADHTQAQVVPSPLRVPSSSPQAQGWHDYPSRMAQQQRETCLYSENGNGKNNGSSVMEMVLPPPGIMVPGQAGSPVGATLRGPFTLADMP